MIWVILAVLGVPLWLLAVAVLSLILRTRGVRKRPGNIVCRLRRASGDGWIRGNAVWVHDVFVFRGSLAAWKEAQLWISSVDTGEPTGKDARRLRRPTAG